MTSTSINQSRYAIARGSGSRPYKVVDHYRGKSVVGSAKTRGGAEEIIALLASPDRMRAN